MSAFRVQNRRACLWQPVDLELLLQSLAELPDDVFSVNANGCLYDADGWRAVLGALPEGVQVLDVNNTPLCDEAARALGEALDDGRLLRAYANNSLSEEARRRAPYNVWR